MATYQKNNSGKRALLRAARKGVTFYGTAEVSRRVAPYEDKVLAKRFKVTHMNGILGGPMVGSRSLESLLWEYGPLSDSQPAGVRGEWEPAPQVAGPLGVNTKRELNRAELRNLAKENRDARAEQKKAGRRRWL
jgi:hypothetical protein